jgi:hypothetical protein
VLGLFADDSATTCPPPSNHCFGPDAGAGGRSYIMKLMFGSTTFPAAPSSASSCSVGANRLVFESVTQRWDEPISARLPGGAPGCTSVSHESRPAK